MSLSSGYICGYKSIIISLNFKMPDYEAIFFVIFVRSNRFPILIYKHSLFFSTVPYYYCKIRLILLPSNISNFFLQPLCKYVVHMYVHTFASPHYNGSKAQRAPSRITSGESSRQVTHAGVSHMWVPAEFFPMFDHTVTIHVLHPSIYYLHTSCQWDLSCGVLVPK